MVHKLSAKEVVDTWELFMRGLRKVFTVTEEEEKCLFNKCLLGVSQVWAGYEEGNKVPIYLVVTTLTQLPSTGTKVLLISHLFSMSDKTIDSEIWKTDFKVVVSYAKTQNCTRIDCMTTSEVVLKIFKSLATEVEERLYLSINIKD